MTTFTAEFQSVESATMYVRRIQSAYEGVTAICLSHRVVDVAVPDDRSDVRRFVADVAALFGGRGEWAAPSDERLYLLTVWGERVLAEAPEGSGYAASVVTIPADELETTLTTLAEFFAANPEDAAYIREHHPDPTVPSGYRGGGGAQPLWRLEKTAYVGRRQP